jgi:hypothetical protein
MNVCVMYTRSASERSTLQCRGNRSRIDGNKLRYFHRAAIGDYDPSFVYLPTEFSKLSKWEWLLLCNRAGLSQMYCT